MSSIGKEEDQIIDKIFSWCSTSNGLVIIKKSIAEVKEKKGLYQESVKCKGDLYSFKFIVSDYTGLNIKASGELARELSMLAKAHTQRERLIEKARISYGIWVYTKDICNYPSHAKLNGKKFLIKRGAKVGFFKHIHTGGLVGCGCFSKPVLPF